MDLHLSASVQAEPLWSGGQQAPLRSNGPVRLIAALWRLFRDLVRDLAPGASEGPATSDEQAPDDDTLDAALDEDGMDATGL